MSILLAEASRQGFAHVRGLDVTALSRSTAAAAALAFETLEGAFPEFGELSQSMRAKMAMAGLRGEWRPVDVATEFYGSSIPFPVRNLGQDAVEMFVDGKHASHIESVHNEAGEATDSANIVRESAGDNLSRGAANMTPFELAQPTPRTFSTLRASSSRTRSRARPWPDASAWRWKAWSASART